MYNREHYPDHTAGKALRNIEIERLSKTIKAIKAYLEANNYELLNRIELKDKTTGKIYK